MSVIVSRALPDVRDGLKPVHRRILFSMHENGHLPDQQIREIGPRRRRRDGQISPARRHRDLRRAGAHGAGLLDAPAAHRRAGQLRLGRRRSARRHALHRVPAGAARDGAARGHRQGHRRFPGQLRRQRKRADGSAGALPEPAGQRRRRHRGRHGDQYPAAQSRRDHRRLHGADRRPGARHRRADQHRAGAGLSDRRHHPRPPGHPRRLSPRPRLDRDARQGRDRDHAQGARGDHHLGDPLPGEQGQHGRAHRRAGAREEDRRHRRSARRVRPRRLPRGGRAQARGDAGRGAQPALSLHAAAIDLRRQHGGARRRASAGDDAQGHADGLRRVPRGGGVAAHQVPARQGARPRPCPGRSRHRGRQYRRGDPAHPRRARIRTRRAKP